MSALEFCMLLAQIETIDNAVAVLFGQVPVNQEAVDKGYAQRYVRVFQAAGIAAKLNYTVDIRIDPKDTDWPILCIVLPGVGEVSWHMPVSKRPFSGYDTKEKYVRVNAFIKEQFPGK